MRLFLLPVSTRRTLLYYQRKQEASAVTDRTYLEWAVNKATTQWAAWEKSEKGMFKYITVQGNKLLNRLPYEEWGLRTIPRLTERGKKELLTSNKKIDVLFPGLFMKESRVPSILHKLATERQQLHRSRLRWSLIFAPLMTPFALVPVIPNIPQYYLLFRAYCHWTALNGARHLEFLTANKLFNLTPSTALDEGYARGLLHNSRDASRTAASLSTDTIQTVVKLIEEQTQDGKEDVMVLQRWNAKLLAEEFKLPEMEVELERAIDQVENDLERTKDLKEQKARIQKATDRPKSKEKSR